MSDVLILVLPNGDQLLAETDQAEGAYVCTNVLQILTRGDETTGHMSMGLVPYLPFSAGDIAIPTFSTIVAVPNDELKNHYAKQFGKIITPPEQKIFVG